MPRSKPLPSFQELTYVFSAVGTYETNYCFSPYLTKQADWNEQWKKPRMLMVANVGVYTVRSASDSVATEAAAVRQPGRSLSQLELDEKVHRDYLNSFKRNHQGYQLLQNGDADLLASAGIDAVAADLGSQALIAGMALFDNKTHPDLGPLGFLYWAKSFEAGVLNRRDDTLLAPYEKEAESNPFAEINLEMIKGPNFFKEILAKILPDYDDVPMQEVTLNNEST